MHRWHRSPLSQMKLTFVVVLITLCLVCQSFSQSVTYFSDNACKNPVASPFQGAPNPLSFSLSKCTVGAVLQGGTIYVKADVCSSSNFSFSIYGDNTCSSATLISEVSNKTCSCITSDPPPNSKSFRIDCTGACPAPVPVKSSASSSSLFEALILSIAFVVCSVFF
jgi:hypothetical protein